MLNFLFKIISAIKKIYWFIFRPITLGVKNIITNNASQILLIKTRYNKYWSLPGGGVKKGETIFECAQREIKEELGVKLKEFKILSAYSSFLEYKNDHIILLRSNVSDQKIIKGLEIDQFEFFDLENLPKDISPATKRRLEEYQNNKFSGERW